MPGSTQPDDSARGTGDAEQPRDPHVSGPQEQLASADPVKSRLLQRACGSTGTILATLSRADLDRPTPCTLWTVRDVVNHLVAGAGYFAQLAGAGEVEDRDNDPDFTAGDFNAAFGRGASRLVAAFDAPGAMDEMMKMPFGDTPGRVCAYIAAGDIFTHGWDLAKATGQSTDLEPDLAAMLLEQIIKILPDSMRGPEGAAPFGPRVEITESASPADQLAAFQGRQP
jgi:uncharacterized protein (TIGR03086 family)